MRKKIMILVFLITLLCFMNPVFAAGTNTVKCGNITNIPKKIPEITNDIVNIIHVAVPVVLVFLGSIDLIKGIISGKDDEIKKGQRTFVKRLFIAVLVFFMMAITEFVISIIDSDNSTNIISCTKCFVVSVNKCK